MAIIQFYCDGSTLDCTNSEALEWKRCFPKELVICNIDDGSDDEYVNWLEQLQLIEMGQQS